MSVSDKKASIFGRFHQNSPQQWQKPTVLAQILNNTKQIPSGVGRVKAYSWCGGIKCYSKPHIEIKIRLGE